MADTPRFDVREVTPVKWPDGWLRTRIQDRKTRSGWKKTKKDYQHLLLIELKRLGATAVLITSTPDDVREPGVAVYFSRKTEDYSWQDALGLQGVPTIEQIEKAYRERALLYHPDRGGDPNTFIALAKHRDNAKRWVLGTFDEDHEHVIACDVFKEVRLNLAAIRGTLYSVRMMESYGASNVLDRVMEKTFARQFIAESSSTSEQGAA